MKATLFFIILSSSLAATAPVPQGAGFGAACDSILTEADSGSGLAVKEGLQNAASLVKSTKRQGAGVGAGCNSILTEADSGSGLAVKEGLQNAASLLESSGVKRQLDKIGAGTASLINIVSPGAAAYQEGLTNTIDGDGTSDSATIGQQVGALELEAGEGAGNLVPSKAPAKAPAKAPRRRQLDKMGAGVASVVSIASPDAAGYQEGLTNNIDGYGTSDSAVIGQQVGALELEAGEGAGNLVPSKTPAH